MRPALLQTGGDRMSPDGQKSRTERWLFVAISLLGLLLALLMPVFSQEAYYWTYAQQPGLSYFDHPPMVAWLIWLGTAVLGDGALGLRFGTWACSVGTAWLGLLLLRRGGVGLAGTGAWLVLTSGVPILTMTKFLANPDAPLAFFWTLCLWALWHAREGRIGWWMLAGAAAGGALLSKYTAVFLAVGGVLILLLDPRFRQQLRRSGPWLGVLVAAACFQPVVWWNVQHDFASFAFQTKGRLEHSTCAWNRCLDFLVGQVGVVNPVVAVALAVVLLHFLRLRLRPPLVLFLLAFALPLPLFLVVDALWVTIKMNWLVPAYIPLLLCGCVWWDRHGSTLPRWAHRVLVISVVAVAVGSSGILVVRFLPQSGGTTWAGWDEIAVRACHWHDQLEGVEGAGEKAFYFAGDYRDASQLGRGLNALSAAGQAPSVLAQNVFGEPALMYDYWFDPCLYVASDAVFVVACPARRPQMLAKALACFQSVERVETVQVQRLGRTVMDADIFVCRHYLGPRRL